MSELSKVVRPLMGQELEAELVNALRAPLAVCAALPGAPTVSQALQLTWARLFSSERIQPDELTQAFDQFLITNKWFPAPAEIIAIVKEIRQERQRKAEIDQTQALTAPKKEGPSITREERQAILAKMKPGAREYFLRVVGE